MKLGFISQRIQLSNDVLIVRLENIFSDRSRSVKDLERKLDSLHRVRYDLNVDLLKTEEVLHAKDKALKEGDNSMNVIADMKGLIESDADTSEQSERLGEFKAMVVESQGYVGMLETKLVRAKEEKEALSVLLILHACWVVMFPMLLDDLIRHYIPQSIDR
ncbi:hypothetical protein [Marinomonas sp. 2405UD68-3]|uniref:hypothetical protein n=1 Tax=Marinomonas sp. 2405UD68-3 TaxID=3391835 RepID=UPI0039C8C7EE